MPPFKLRPVHFVAAFAATLAVMSAVRLASTEPGSGDAGVASDGGDVDAGHAAPAAHTPPAPATPEKPTNIPHDLEGRAACTTCHGIAGRHPYPNDHSTRPDGACLSCHVPSHWMRARSPNPPTPPAVSSDFCLSCHTKPGLAMTLPNGDELSLHIDPKVYERSVHGMKGMSCTACHPSNEKHPHAPFAGPSARELNRGIIQQRCAMCHAEVFAAYRESVHGKALVDEHNLDVPTCTDCHGVHDIRHPKTMLFRLDSPDTCSKCHSDAKLMAKYDISPNVATTYLADFHGTSVSTTKRFTPSFGSYKAVCYDCHGIHDIKKAKDPESAVVKENLVKTCRKCHENADTSFPAAWTAHYEPDRRNKWALVYWVNKFYAVMIPTIVGGMALYILMELVRTAIDKWKSWRAS